MDTAVNVLKAPLLPAAVLTTSCLLHHGLSAMLSFCSSPLTALLKRHTFCIGTPDFGDYCSGVFQYSMRFSYFPWAIDCCWLKFPTTRERKGKEDKERWGGAGRKRRRRQMSWFMLVASCIFKYFHIFIMHLWLVHCLGLGLLVSVLHPSRDGSSTQCNDWRRCVSLSLSSFCLLCHHELRPRHTTLPWSQLSIAWNLQKL